MEHFSCILISISLCVGSIGYVELVRPMVVDFFKTDKGWHFSSCGYNKYKSFVKNPQNNWCSPLIRYTCLSFMGYLGQAFFIFTVFFWYLNK